MLDVAIALAGFTVGEAEGLRRDEPQAEPRALRGAPDALRRGRGRKGAEKVADGVAPTRSSASGWVPRRMRRRSGLAYQSAWLRHHYPPWLLCGLLNEQPMLLPAREPRPRRAAAWVEVRPPDVNLSEARCSSSLATV